MIKTPRLVTRITAAAGMAMALTIAVHGQADAQAVQSSTTSTTQSISGTAQEDKQHYVITGDLSALFASGEMVIYTREPKGKASSGGGMMMAATTMTAATPEASASPAGPGTTLVASAELIDGKFRVEGELSKIHPVYFHIAEGMTHDGRRMGQVKGQVFILEPGELTMTMGPNFDWIVRGEYNDIVFNSWKESDAYRGPKSQLTTLPIPGDDEEAIAAHSKKVMALQNQFLEAEFSARERIAKTHPDMLARELAITTGFISFGWEPDAVRGILKEDPDNQWAKDYITQWEARRAKLESEGTGVNIGDYAKYFDGQTLDDETVSLRDVCGDNKYVLLEFWASWCGPCRAEIPNMKKVYAKYHDAGFEIFSFTIDKDKAAWAKASKDEELPWINTGFGQESKPKKLYQVTGVPNNYLIDCETGKVIAKNLRGTNLGDKLEELF